MVLHEDKSSGDVAWDAGGKRNVIMQRCWYVDEEVLLRNDYRWYSHGLPMWPLPAKKKSWYGMFWMMGSRWPNYALATPLYLVPAISDPGISIGKFFGKDLKRPRSDTVDSFSRPEVQEYVRQLVKKQFFEPEQNLLSLATWRENATRDFDQYEHWFRPVVQESLKPMIMSFRKQHRSKCPDEIYVFFFRQPCESLDSCQVTADIRKESDTCRSTELVVGFLEPLKQ